MIGIIDLLQNLIDPNWIMENGGLLLVLFIIFIETGLLIGFFLPGDPLLFITGVIIASVTENQVPFGNNINNLIFWISLISLAAILGNFMGYWIGRRFGTVLLNKKDNWIFKQKHLKTAQDLYETKGWLAIILARFLPVVRTFAPVIAGIVSMDFKKFTFYNIVGGVVWVGSLTSLGFLLGDNEWIRKNLEIVILSIVLLSTSPVLFKLILNKTKASELNP